MLAASGSRMCVSPALIDHQHGAAVTQLLTRSHASNPALVAGPGVRCLATAERRQVEVNGVTWRFIGRPELADMHALPARAILTLRRAYSALYG
jgi:hypothetical protein